MARDTFERILEQTLGDLTPCARLRARSTITTAQALAREVDRLVDNIMDIAGRMDGGLHAPLEDASESRPRNFFNSGGEPLDKDVVWDRSGETKPSEPLNLLAYRIDEETLKLLPHEVARANRIIPLFRYENALLCAVSAEEMTYDFKSLCAVDNVRFLTGYEVRVIAVTPQSFATVMEYYDRQATEDNASVQTSGELEPSGQIGHQNETAPGRKPVLVYEGALHTSRGVLPEEMPPGEGTNLTDVFMIRKPHREGEK